MNWKKAFTLGLLAPGVWDGEIEEWETLFEGTVTTAVDAATVTYARGYNYANEICLFLGMANGDKVRLTCNGVSKVYTLTVQLGFASCGNKAIIKPDDYTDDGFSLYVEGLTALASNFAINWFYTPEAGTYSIKIERLVS